MKKFNEFLTEKININDLNILSALSFCKDAELLPNGKLKLNVYRFQKPIQFGKLAVRSGVFYLPSKVTYDLYKDNFNMANFGGPKLVHGTITISNPCVVEANIGGAAPRKAFQKTFGDSKWQTLRNDTDQITDLIRQPDECISLIQKKLKKWKCDDSIAEYMYKTSSNDYVQLEFAFWEYVIANKMRERGFDSILSYIYSFFVNGEILTELFYLNQTHYPSKSGFEL